jgi:hypothetical protein
MSECLGTDNIIFLMAYSKPKLESCITIDFKLCFKMCHQERPRKLEGIGKEWRSWDSSVV